MAVLLPRLPNVNVATILLLSSLTNALQLDASHFPSAVHLKAAVLHSPPMAIVERLESGETSFSGFQIDLLERLKIFAAQDGVDLHLDLMQSPPLYSHAFNLLANDCNTTANPNKLEDCHHYDMIIGDYYTNADRYMRADLSPPWMSSSMATIKYVEKEYGIPDVTTLAEAETEKAAVCLPMGTYLSQVVQQRFPAGQYVHCDMNSDCIGLLQNGSCSLYAQDELLLKYTVSHEVSLELTGETFNSQYYVWPMKVDLTSLASKLMKKWMYDAIQNATLDELYVQYFKNGQCPLGTAGENCDLPCDPDHGRADTSGECVCESAKWTGDDCSIEVMENPNMIPPSLIKVCYVLAGINLVLVAVCAAWVFKNRKRSHIRMAQPMFLAMILVGCVISTSSVFAMAQQDSGDGPVPVCAAIPWLYSIGFSLTFGAMYARIRRIYKVLRHSVDLKRVTISARETILTAMLVFGIDVIILTLWTIADPLKWQRTITTADVFGAPLESEGYCNSDYWEVFAGLIALFHLMLMVVALYRCYKARKIPERVSNGKYVAIAMFCNFQIFLVGIPVLIMLGSGNPQASFFVKSVAICLNDLVVVSLIFGDLKYKIRQHDIQAEYAVRLSRTSSAHRIKSDLRKYARAMKGFSSHFGFGPSIPNGLERNATMSGLGASTPTIACFGGTSGYLGNSSQFRNSSGYLANSSQFRNEDVNPSGKKCHGESCKNGGGSSLGRSMFHDESTYIGSTIHDSETSARLPFGRIHGLEEAKLEVGPDDLETQAREVGPSFVRRDDSLGPENRKAMSAQQLHFGSERNIRYPSSEAAPHTPQLGPPADGPNKSHDLEPKPSGPPASSFPLNTPLNLMVESQEKIDTGQKQAEQSERDFSGPVAADSDCCRDDQQPE